MSKRPGLYANIQKKRRRIAAGYGEKMRKPGSKGAPTAANFRRAAKTAKKKVRAAPKTPKAGTPRTKKEVQASARRKRRAAFDKAPSFKNAVDYLIQSGN